MTQDQRALIMKVANSVAETQPLWAAALHAALDEIAAADLVRTAIADVKIGQLVRAKLTSLNKIPVERCTVTASEVREIDNGR